MQWLNGSRRRDFDWRRAPLSQDAFEGKRIAVIGGTSGIGRAFAHAIAAKGAEVTVVGRTFLDQGVGRIRFIKADLALLKQARHVAQELPAETLDALILTTGILAGRQRKETPEGIELDLAVSYLSRFVIVREAAERLGANRIVENGKPRVFIMGVPGVNQKGSPDDLNSEGHYDSRTSHGNTIIGNEALVLDGATRYSHVNFYGLYPGLVKSNIFSGLLGQGSFSHRAVQLLIGALFQSAQEYADKIAPLLVSPDIENHSGAMFNRHGDPIHASVQLTTGPVLQKIIGGSERLVRKALG
ncbi:MAG: SDR family NAD(P)-dependent oxidoreductase [Anaerolineae bacterium]|nr:SDR family NAD(P)-dependent oxidoreductase [Gemmatimonadaceae bacterium]